VCVGACAIAAVTAAGTALAAPASTKIPSSRNETLVIAGAGDGHGVGMSQDGALGLAEHGYSYQGILAHYYTGTALGSVAPKQTVRVLLDNGKILTMGLERYVRGVVGAEVSPSWPLAALEAQAVASRTYVLTSHAGGARFNVYSDTRSQVYMGKAAETPETDAAVAATKGQIVTYNGQPAITYFFASSGGLTENVANAFPGAESEPWLRGVTDPYESGPQRRWTITLTMAAAEKRLRGLVRGRLEGIKVLKRGWSPRIVSASVLGSEGQTEVSGPELEARLGLYSTWAYFSIDGPHGTRVEPDLSHYNAPRGSETVAQAPTTGVEGTGSQSQSAPSTGQSTSPNANGEASASNGATAAGPGVGGAVSG
jgi:SpoIID/LytB domain protein